MTGTYALNENVFAEDEVLSSYITNRPYSQVTDPDAHNAPLSSNDNRYRESRMNNNWIYRKHRSIP
jgi:hypothetical protein